MDLGYESLQLRDSSGFPPDSLFILRDTGTNSLAKVRRRRGWRGRTVVNQRPPRAAVPRAGAQGYRATVLVNGHERK